MQRRAELQQVNGAYWCETGLTGTVALVPISVSGAGARCNSRPPPSPSVSPEPLPSNCD